MLPAICGEFWIQSATALSSVSYQMAKARQHLAKARQQLAQAVISVISIYEVFSKSFLATVSSLLFIAVFDAIQLTYRYASNYIAFNESYLFQCCSRQQGLKTFIMIVCWGDIHETHEWNIPPCACQRVSEAFWAVLSQVYVLSEEKEFLQFDFNIIAEFKKKKPSWLWFYYCLLPTLPSFWKFAICSIPSPSPKEHFWKVSHFLALGIPSNEQYHISEGASHARSIRLYESHSIVIHASLQTWHQIIERSITSLLTMKVNTGKVARINIKHLLPASDYEINRRLPQRSLLLSY